MTPVRPALAATLASLSECPIGSVRDALATTDGEPLRIVIERESDRHERLCVRRYYAGRSRGWLFPLTHTDPVEAFECLTLRDVLPLAWASDSSRAFWCAECDGTGGRRYPGTVETPDEWEWCDACGREDLDATGGVIADGTTPTPQTMPDLVAWSSLGAETILAAEELAREIERRLRPWGVAARDRRCVWKVAPMPEPLPEREEKLPEGWPRDANNPTNGDPSDERPDHWREWWAEHAPKGKRTRSTWWEAHVDLWPKDDPRPCPHEPVLALLRMDLALDALTDDALVVVVPPL